jgi:pimeloyl-ACP methyl ester carboxylesterase
MHAAWCWDEHFLDYFAVHGFRTVALSFRAHGASTSSKPLSKCSISDYVDDVRTVVGDLGELPVLIGHSVGGFVVQKYLERDDAPAAVLMASTPPSGILRSSMRVWRRHPLTVMRANVVGRSHDAFNSPQAAREYFYSSYTSDDVVRSGAARVEPESIRAVFFNQVFGLPAVDRITTPLLVLGADDDGLISTAEVRSTAHAYGTEAVLFPRMGHNMMVEPDWRDVADHVIRWLADRDL